MNAGFRREAERRGLQPDGGLVLVEGVVLDGEGRPVPLDVVSSELTTASLLGPDWRLLELPTAVVNLPTLARRFELLGGQPAALLQVELREAGPGGRAVPGLMLTVVAGQRPDPAAAAALCRRLQAQARPVHLAEDRLDEAVLAINPIALSPEDDAALVAGLVAALATSPER